jgi:arginase
VHLDVDVIDPEQMPAQFPAPGGLAAEKVFDVLEAVAETSELVGLEVTAFEAPEDPEERALLAEIVMHVLEPLLAVVPEEAGVGG